MGNIKIRNLSAATSAEIIAGDMVPIALDNAAGLEKVTRRATFSQIVSGGSGILAADPNSPFVFNNTTTEQVFQGGLTVPGNITLSGDLNLTGTISGNTTGYFDELYISGSAGGWHQITTGWSGSEGGGGGKWIDGAGGDIYYNGGDVGIGTANPDAPLTIHSSTDSKIRFGYSSTQDHSIQWDSSKVHIHADPANDNSSSALGLYVDGRSRLYINADGNVGIGTGLTSPTSLLTLSGDNEDLRIVTDVGGTSVTVIGLLQDASNNGSIEVNNSVGNNKIRLRSTGISVTAVSGAFTESLTVSGNSVLTGSSSALGKWSDGASAGDIYYNGGHVGIGTDAPLSALHLYGAGTVNSRLSLEQTTEELTGTLQQGTNGIGISALGSNNNIFLSTAGVQRVNVLSDGNVGIGEVEPSATLHVAGSTIISGSSEITLDYDRLPKANPDIKGRVWIDVSAGFFMVSAGPPPFIISSSQLRMVAAGEYHSLFLTTAGDVYACGWNTNGQLGDGTTVDKDVPTHITGDVSGIAAGYSHSMFISTAGHAYACGYNDKGQLGDGTTVAKDVPTSITGNVMAIAGGGNHSMFLSTAGHAYACGYNHKGQLGDGTIVDKHVPTHITGDVSGISTMENFSMFLSAVGDSYACGYNNQGELGDNSTVDRHVPTYITGDVTGISAGARLSMFLSTGGDSHACGYGNLGDGNWTSGPQTPTFITGDVTGISAGYDSSRFLSTDNGAYACGANAQGQLGDGTTANLNGFPIHITGDVSGISAGRYTTMFFSTSKDYYACGSNGKGELGDGTNVNKLVPTYISGQGA